MRSSFSAELVGVGRTSLLAAPGLPEARVRTVVRAADQ